MGTSLTAESIHAEPKRVAAAADHPRGHVMPCSACGRENPADAAFCNACGQRLDDAAGAPVKVRRPLTVMFCDLVDSTRLSSGLDPEDWRSILVRYYAACRPAINGHGGLIIQYLGDGVLAYFGFPSASETDAANALRGGLELIERVGELAVDVRAEYDFDLGVRVGVHSGLVVVGDGGEGTLTETQAVGDTLNIAARLQGVASPNSMVISADTLRLVEGLFVVDSLGARELKGLPAPIEVWCVEAAENVSHKLDSPSPRGLSPFVGRAHELRQIMDVWESARRGAATGLVIRGEAGVGKSRLLREARDRVTALGGQWLQGRCLPDTEQSPFASWSHLLRTAIGIEVHTPPEHALELLEATGKALDLAPDVVERLAILLDAVRTTSARTLAADHRRRTIDALIEWLRAQAARAPIVVSIEDLHWADPSTVEVLVKAEADLADAAVILLLTCRPTAKPGLKTARVLELSGLDSSQSRQLAVALGGETFSDELIDTVLERGSGLPLFIEALMRDVVDSSANASAVPPSVLVSLAARLDQLGPARELAQTAAVIGGEVPLRLLTQVSGRDESQLLDEASEIVAAGFSRWSHGSEGPALQFRHALMADAAYDSVPRARRRELHAKVAAQLDGPAERRRHPERIARHYELAEEHRSALDLWQHASKQAVRSYALNEAGSHLDRAITCLGRLGGRLEAATEIRLRLLQLEYLNMRDGFTGVHQQDVLDRVLELIDRDEVDAVSRFQVLLLVTTQNAAVSRVVEANHWADRAEKLAREIGHPMLVGLVGAPVGTARLLNGRYDEARDLTEKALDALGVDAPAPLADTRMGEAWLMTQAILAHACAALGQTDRARRALDDALAGARALDPPDPHSLGLVLYFRAMLLLMEGELDRCVSDGSEMVALGDRHGFAEISAGGRMYEACREMIVGDADLGVAAFRQLQAAVPDFKPFPYFQQVLLEGTARAGRPNEALKGAVAHHNALRERGEHLCSEEFHALIGELQLQCNGDLAAARASCERGLAEAAQCGARGPQLRIAIRLANLLSQVGQNSDAAEVLEGAMADYPAPVDSHRYGQAAALLSRLRNPSPEPASPRRTHAH